MKRFNAPWGKMLWGVSTVTTVILLFIAALYYLAPPRGSWAGTWVLPLLVLAAPVLFTIRSYTITPDSLLVQRLLWSTRLPLAGLQSAQFQPGAMRGGLRKCGNGGAFSFTGWYWNKSLGSYRAFVTDLNRTVVLTFAYRKIVVSPGAPEDFIRELGPLADPGTAQQG